MTSTPGRLVAVGADGARGGWIAACAHASKSGLRTSLHLCRDFEELATLRESTDTVMAVDIPMGLPDRVEPRACDKEARKLLGARWGSVFAPPPRCLLDADDDAEVRERIADARKVDAAVAGLSAQAAALISKIREGDEYLRANPDAQEWLFECHPELSFRALADGRVLDEKRSANGQVERLQLIRGEFLGCEEVIAHSPFPAKQVQLADVLDAYAALSTALVVRAGDHEELGGETDSAGLIMRMVM